MQYQQVLDNLARFATQPSLPAVARQPQGGDHPDHRLALGGAAVDIGPPVTWFPQLLGSRTAVAQWGMSPVIDATELRLLRIAYRRALGVPDMPSPKFLDELAHELKDQFASNADLRNESELFYEFQSRANRSSRELDAHVITTNDDTVCGDPGPRARSLPAGEERLPEDRDDPGRPGRDPDPAGSTWVASATSRRTPATSGGAGTATSGSAPKGIDELTEFTLTVLKISSLIKETQTLINPGSVKFSPGDRGG